jgi:hypothetical protein
MYGRLGRKLIRAPGDLAAHHRGRRDSRLLSPMIQRYLALTIIMEA